MFDGNNIGKGIKTLVNIVIVLGIALFVMTLLWVFSLFGNTENETSPAETKTEQTSTDGSNSN